MADNPYDLARRVVDFTPTEPTRVVLLGIELRITTGQLSTDMPDLLAIREELGNLADRLYRDAPGSKAITLIWGIDHEES